MPALSDRRESRAGSRGKAKGFDISCLAVAGSPLRSYGEAGCGDAPLLSPNVSVRSQFFVLKIKLDLL